MASIRQRIAELERRLIAIEARQIAWRHDAASRAGAPDSVPAELEQFLPTSEMLEALAELRAQCDARGEKPDQVDVGTEDGQSYATAWFVDGEQATATFKKPANFRANDAKKLFEEALLDVQ
jgi:hypothetical protein